MTGLFTNFGSVARRASPRRDGVVPPADAPDLPNFEENAPIRALVRRPRWTPYGPEDVLLPFTNARERPSAP